MNESNDFFTPHFTNTWDDSTFIIGEDIAESDPVSNVPLYVGCTTSSSTSLEDYLMPTSSMNSMSSFDMIENDQQINWHSSQSAFGAGNDCFKTRNVDDMKKITSSESFIQLHFESIASYFHKLVEWRQQSTADWFTTPLFGELVGENGIHSDQSLSTLVSVECNAVSKQLFLVVRGNVTSFVSRRVDRLGKMVDDSLRNRQIHELPGWQSQHRLAIMDSQIIAHQQEVSRACVQFHYSGATTKAEIVSLQPHQHSNLLRFLQALKPRESVWEVGEQDMARYSEVPWEQLRVRYAVYCQWIKVPSSRPYIAGCFLLKVWGFSPGLDEAVRMIQALAGKLLQSDLSRSHSVVSPPLTVVVASVTPRSVVSAPAVRRTFSASYAFRDREAGIFFYAFERQFRCYMEQTFAVALDDFGNKFSSSQQQDRNEDRNAILKITFHGASQSSLASARSYLEQLNPANLTRLQVFFPQVHAAKFKELCNKKTAQQSVLSAMRTTDNHSAAAIVDPMQCQGFVNIRVKPPIHSHGVRRMPLPADCTITICGSNQVAAHAAVLREIEASFCAVGSEYAVGCVNVSFAHPLKKQLTVKAQREEFVQQHGLVAVKWEEGSRLTGSVGVARLWAPSHAALSSAVAAINAAELQAVEEGGSELAGLRESAQWDGTRLSISCSPTTGANRSGSGITPSALMYAFKGLVPSESPACAPVSASVLDGGYHFQSLWGADQETLTAPVSSQSVVYWPDDSLRYVLLSDPLSSLLNNLLFRFYNSGVASKYPYRDRTNPCAGILLQGDSAAVSDATEELNAFLQNATNQLRTVQVLLPYQLYSELVTNELAGIKHVQGQAGVRVVLGAKQSEIETVACSAFDLRLAPTASPGSMDVPLLTVRISGGALSCHSLDVAVISSRTSPAGWTWGVGCLLVMVDASSLAGLQQPEALRLASGEVLVHSDAFTGKTILRIKPREQTQLHGAQQQAKELMTVIAKGLGRAEELGLSGVAVSAPVDCDSFRALDADQVRSLTVEAVVEFCKSAMSLRCLRRVACIDVSAAQSGEGDKTDSSLLAPAGGDPMARTMLSLLEQQHRKQQLSASRGQYVGAELLLSLVDATVALPLEMAGSPHWCQQGFPAVSCPGERRRSYGDQSVLLKGLPCGIRKALEMMGSPVGPHDVSPV